MWPFSTENSVLVVYAIRIVSFFAFQFHKVYFSLLVIGLFKQTSSDKSCSRRQLFKESLKYNPGYLFSFRIRKGR